MLHPDLPVTLDGDVHIGWRELDPAYADVIIRRWQEATGKAVVLESEDRTFADMQAERLATTSERAAVRTTRILEAK